MMCYYLNVHFQGQRASLETRNIDIHRMSGNILSANYVFQYQHRPADGTVFTQLHTVMHRKVQIHPTTRHKSPQGQQRYKVSISLTSALDGGGGCQRHAPAALHPGESLGIRCRGSWVVWTVTVAPTGPQTPGPSNP